MSDDLVRHPETGEVLGQLVMVDDTTAVLLDDEGKVVQAIERDESQPDGWATLDPGDFVVEGEGEQHAAQPDLEQQVAELQQFAQDFDPMRMREEARAMGRAASGHQAEEAWAVRTGRELRNLEEAIGRPLTQAETWRILEEHHGDFELGIPAEDIAGAVGRAGLIEFSPGQDFGETDAQHAEGRRAYMAQLVEDSEREERGDTPDDRPAWVEPVSSDPGDVRRARITNLAHGHEDPGPDPGGEGME